MAVLIELKSSEDQGDMETWRGMLIRHSRAELLKSGRSPKHSHSWYCWLGNGRGMAKGIPLTIPIAGFHFSSCVKGQYLELGGQNE